VSRCQTGKPVGAPKAITRNGPAFTLSYDHGGNLACKIGQNTGTTTCTWNAGDSLLAT